MRESHTKCVRVGISGHCGMVWSAQSIFLYTFCDSQKISYFDIMYCMKIVFVVKVGWFTTLRNGNSKLMMRWYSVRGILKVFTHLTLESGERTKFTTNLINIFVLANPLPNHLELVRDKIWQSQQIEVTIT